MQIYERLFVEATEKHAKDTLIIDTSHYRKQAKLKGFKIQSKKNEE
jgi:hypothetical protein